MVRNLLEIGQRLIINDLNNSVRHGVILLVGNLFLAAALIFAVEIALILLGIGNIFLPWTRQTLEMISQFLFKSGGG